MKAFNAVTQANAKQVHVGSHTETWNSFQDKPEYKSKVGVNRPQFPKLGRHQRDQLYQELLQPSSSSNPKAVVIQSNPEPAAADPPVVEQARTKTTVAATYGGGGSGSDSDSDSDQARTASGTIPTGPKFEGTVTKTDAKEQFCFINGNVFGHRTGCTNGWPVHAGDEVEYYREANDHPKNKWRASSFAIVKRGSSASSSRKRTATSELGSSTTTTFKKQKVQHPANHLDAVQALMAAKHQSAIQPQQQQQGGPSVAGWMSAVDGTGKVYYYHTVTRETRWTRPGSSSSEVGGSTWVTADAKLKKKLAKLKAKRDANR